MGKKAGPAEGEEQCGGRTGGAAGAGGAEDRADIGRREGSGTRLETGGKQQLSPEAGVQAPPLSGASMNPPEAREPGGA